MEIIDFIILVPFLTVLSLFFARDLSQIRLFSAVGMGVQLLQSFALLFMYLRERKNGAEELMLFQKDVVWFPDMNIHYSVGVDGVAVAMILLTSIVIFAGIFVSWNVKELSREFFISLIILAAGVFGFFVSLDLFTMFLFYEVAVIPMYLLIGIWGTGPKEYSAMKLTLMLMAGSAFLLFGLLGIYFESGIYSFNILELGQSLMSKENQMLFFPFVFIGFGVLGALFPFHTWSPDGHASAPTAVSMLHAGVLMKLGGYGCFRVAMFLMPEAAQELSWIFIILTAISVIYGAFGAIKQTDLKYINAYSSVSHCGLVLFAILMINKTAWNGAVLQMLSHGLMTALFFALIGMLYGRTHTRDIREMSGLMKVLPFLSVMYVLAGLASLGLPGLSGFVAEMNIFVGAFQHEDPFYRLATVISVSAIVVTAVYILQVVGRMLMGPINKSKYNELEPAKWHEKVGTLLLLIPIVVIGTMPWWLSDMILESLGPVLRGF